MSSWLQKMRNGSVQVVVLHYVSIGSGVYPVESRILGSSYMQKLEYVKTCHCRLFLEEVHDLIKELGLMP